MYPWRTITLRTLGPEPKSTRMQCIPAAPAPAPASCSSTFTSSQLAAASCHPSSQVPAPSSCLPTDSFQLPAQAAFSTRWLQFRIPWGPGFEFRRSRRSRFRILLERRFRILASPGVSNCSPGFEFTVFRQCVYLSTCRNYASII